METAGTRLKRLIERPEIVVLPGVHDAISAKLAEIHGFEAVMAGGNAAHGALLAEADLGQLGLRDYADHYGRIAGAVNIPVLVDADTGFGGAFSVRHVVRNFERAGIGGFFIEDQTMPKRCGYLAGKSLVPVAEMLDKLKAALDARHDPDLIICARTDAFSIEDRDRAIERAQAYLETGVDMTFVQGADTPEDLSTVCAAISCPQLANISQAAGPGKAMTRAQVAKAGAAAVMYPLATILAAAGAVDRMLAALRQEGELDTAHLMGIGRYNEVTGLPELA